MDAFHDTTGKGRQDLARRHWTFPARSRKKRWRRRIHGALEKLLCRFAVHGDRPVFASDQFHWISTVEANWRQVRRELDGVMTYREACLISKTSCRKWAAFRKMTTGKPSFSKASG